MLYSMLQNNQGLWTVDVWQVVLLLRLEVHRQVKHLRSVNQSKVLTKPHMGRGEATSQHHHRGGQTLHHKVMQAWGAMNESRQH